MCGRFEILTRVVFVPDIVKPLSSDNSHCVAPVGTKDCQGVCDRDVLMTKTGPVVICKGCMRIVMDNRKWK